jgi:Ca2+-binding RTX toxin-like protein
MPTTSLVTLSGSHVHIVPDPNLPANVASVAYSPDGLNVVVTLNGVDSSFPASQVAGVNYLGAGVPGNHSFTNNIGILSTATGGVGNNEFTAGTGIDNFTGGAGPNTFNGGSGHTTMNGSNAGSNVFNEGVGSGLIVKFASASNVVNGANANYRVFSL